MAGLLEGAARLIMLQFAFSSLELVPSCLKRKTAEKPDKPAKKYPSTGEQFIEEVENVQIKDFLYDLKQEAYELVDAYCQIRIKGGRQCAIARFMFAAKDYISLSDEFKIVRENAELALLQIIEESMWRVKAFLNPFYEEGQALDNVYVISINLDSRQPLTDDNGQLILRWQKDENGKRIGDGPVPLKPKKFLRIENGDVRIA